MIKKFYCLSKPDRKIKGVARKISTSRPLFSSMCSDKFSSNKEWLAMLSIDFMFQCVAIKKVLLIKVCPSYFNNPLLFL